jgi:hypothetical protein
VKIEHNYTAPDPAYAIPYRLSPNHYWKVDGILPSIFRSKATLNYDGRTTSFSGNYWLDNNLVTTFEDSLVLLYRRDASVNWGVYPFYTKNMLTNNNDKRGIITIDSLQLGEYVFAMMDYASGIQQAGFVDDKHKLALYPNPANDKLTIDLLASGIKSFDNAICIITDVSGKIIYKEKLKHQNTISINTVGFSNGMYFVSLKTKDEKTTETKFVIAH